MSPVTNRLGYGSGPEDGPFEFGLLDPETMNREWTLHTTNAGFSYVAFSPQGRKVAFSSDPDKSDHPSLTVLEDGKAPREFNIPVTEKEKLALGECAFSPRGDKLFAAFSLETEDTPGSSMGFVEMPLDGSSSTPHYPHS